jgi:hypothetical protein
MNANYSSNILLIHNSYLGALAIAYLLIKHAQALYSTIFSLFHRVTLNQWLRLHHHAPCHHEHTYKQYDCTYERTMTILYIFCQVRHPDEDIHVKLPQHPPQH